MCRGAPPVSRRDLDAHQAWNRLGHLRTLCAGDGTQADPSRHRAGVGVVDRSSACRPNSPIEVSAEWAWSGAADRSARLPGVRRHHPRVVEWTIQDARDIYTWPNANWHGKL